MRVYIFVLCSKCFPRVSLENSDGRDSENGIIVSRAFRLSVCHIQRIRGQSWQKLIQFASIESALLNSSPFVAAMETHTTTSAYSTLRRGAVILCLPFDAMANAASVDISERQKPSTTIQK
ncbi:uncharacterized protein LOC135194889 [Macrobrachium nipponense]|uniref:uncharacterized protein LOC135194889 n=1 Tax=Macrobrachium nipponense TaxID=159736 RepID=UPI0030C7C10F